MGTRDKFIAIVDSDTIKKSDAIVLLEGDGLNRIHEAVRLFKSGMSDLIVFSGGISNIDFGSIPFNLVLPELLSCGLHKDCIIHEGKSRNTRDQALHVLHLAQVRNWNKLILVASHYHQYRAYLTFLKVILQEGMNITLYNSPARQLSWFEETGWGRRIDLLQTEFLKIKEYSKLGHIASFIEALEYQKWKESQL